MLIVLKKAIVIVRFLQIIYFDNLGKSIPAVTGQGRVRATYIQDSLPSVPENPGTLGRTCELHTDRLGIQKLAVL